ncbi:MAG TPA: beta-ketoacyl-[acyl-carrier-protein] synthase family protein [Planctomycetota bacterium]
MASTPVCITGIGAVTPLGPDAPSSWRELLAGTIALRVGHLGLADTLAEYPVGVADIEPAVARVGMQARDRRRLDPISVQAICAAAEALDDAGLETPVEDARVSVVMGIGFGAALSHYHIVEMCLKGKAHRMNPFTIPAAMPNSASCNVSLQHRSRGPSWTIATACAAGTDAIGIALWLVQSGQADVVIAGGTEHIANDVGVGGMSAARALAKVVDGDLGVLRPFDRRRKGTVVGEGAALFVLESPAHAANRGARVHGLLHGYGSGSDGYHITQPQPDGSGAVDVMQRALAAAGMEPGRIDAIYAHGTGTPLNDSMEGKAVSRLFGPKPPLVTSTKGQYGHTMAASGPMNVAFALLGMAEGVVPRTLNCTDPDPECAVAPVIGEHARGEFSTVMVNSFGFGGHNASLVLSRA